MIEFKHEKEREIILLYASRLDNNVVLDFISSGSVKDESQVRSIANFYWKMVDTNVEDKKENTERYENMEVWLERIYTSFHIYFNNIGYGEVWDSEIP